MLLVSDFICSTTLLLNLTLRPLGRICITPVILLKSDQFQGEVVSPDGDDNDQSSRGKDDDDSDDEMNPEDQVYPI